uniref:Transposase (Putative), gypsy type n=1 Tax=Tanacetum cinerariifolium TaxID=118510 RepID=A0A6L2P747_TANCI|nr:hypothetical protein [Tanacetum cinerariifolium]
MFKNDTKDRICALSKNDLKDLVNTYRIPLDLHPRFPDPGFTMDRLPADVHISQLVPLGLNKVVSFEVVCRGLNIFPIVTLFRVFQCLCKQGDWFSFSKHHNTEEVCMDDGPSSLKKQKNKFFLIDRRVILDHLTWRHSCTCVSEYLPSDGYNQNNVQRLCARLIHLCETREKAKGTDEADLANLCDEIEDSLERDGGVSMRVVSAPRPRLGKRLDAPPSIAVVTASEQSHVGTPTPASTSSHSLSLGGIALACDAEYDQILDDDFGITTRSEEIDLKLFSLAPSPYHMPYPYEGVSSPLYTREEWNRPHAPKHSILCKDIFKDLDVCMKALDRTITLDALRRTESLLPLELSNHVNVLIALFVSYGYELNSHYANLVSFKAQLQEKLDKKKRGVKLIRSEVTSLDSKLENLQRESCSKLSDEFHVALARVTSLGISYGVERGLRMGSTDVEFEAAVQKVSNFHVGAKADFDKFPLLPPVLMKVQNKCLLDHASDDSAASIYTDHYAC